MLLARFLSESDGFLFSNGSFVPETVNLITLETIYATRNQRWLYWSPIPDRPFRRGTTEPPLCLFCFYKPHTGSTPRA